MSERPTKRLRKSSEDEEASEAESSSSQVSDEGETDVEIVSKNQKKLKKRKRALSPTSFGVGLQSLLDQPEPSAAAIAHLNNQASSRAEKASRDIEKKALKYLQFTKKERAEQGHVTDIIGGWTARPKKPFSQWAKHEEDEDYSNVDEFTLGGAAQEKAFRKLAQRGVVKLFNAIKAAQEVTEEKPKLVSKKATVVPAESTKVVSDKHLPNMLGTKGKEQALANLSKDTFLQILKGQPTHSAKS